MVEDYMTGAVIPDDMPEDLLGNPDVQKLIDNAHKVLEHFDNFIDPDSDYYREELHNAEERGAIAVAEYYSTMLSEALYRQRLFGEQFDLEKFADKLETVQISEVLDEAR